MAETFYFEIIASDKENFTAAPASRLSFRRWMAYTESWQTMKIR